MYCPRCGTQNADSNKFCVGCGVPFKKKSNIKGLVLIGVGVAVLMAIFTVFGILLLDDSPSEVTVRDDQPQVIQAPRETLPAVRETQPPVTQAPTVATQPEGYIEMVDGDWESVTLHSGRSTLNVSAFAFYEKVRRCEEMTIHIDVTMNAGARCKDWQVWGRVNGNFQVIGSMYLSDGTGSASKTLKFKNPITLDAVAVTPTALGGYSWSMGLAVTDVWYDA